MESKEFNYDILKETEKAVFVKVPYWESTNHFTKKHKQLWFECWVPKVLLTKTFVDIKNFVIATKEKICKTNSYQKVLYTMPSSFNTMGEYAPDKTKEIVEEIDYDKLNILRRELMTAYGVKVYDQGFFINPADNITDDVEKLAKVYRNPCEHKGNPVIPLKKVSYYK
jgi:hypothetical protein